MTRETVGKISSDLLQKTSDNTHSAHDQMSEQLIDYENNVLDCLQRGKKLFIGNFYIVVLTKKERLMPNVLRNYFFPRISCPTPEWDQAVYRYNASEDSLDFLWVIPSKDTCEYMKYAALSMSADKEHITLLHYVLDFYNGNLLKISQKLNAETLAHTLLN